MPYGDLDDLTARREMVTAVIKGADLPLPELADAIYDGLGGNHERAAELADLLRGES